MNELRYTVFKNKLGDFCLLDNKEGQGTILIGKEFEATYLRDRLNVYEYEISLQKAEIERLKKELETKEIISQD